MGINININKTQIKLQITVKYLYNSKMKLNTGIFLGDNEHNDGGR